MEAPSRGATTGSSNVWLAGCGLGLLTGWHLAPTNTRIKPKWEIGVGGVRLPARRERAAIGRHSVPRWVLTLDLGGFVPGSGVLGEG